MASVSSEAQTTILAFREFYLATLEPPSPGPRPRRRTESQHPLDSHFNQGLEEPSTPPLSPSAITPEGELDREDTTFPFEEEEMPLRERAHSTPPGSIDEGRRWLEEMVRQSGVEATSESAKKAKKVARRLVLLGEDLEKSHNQSLVQVLRGLIVPDPSILHDLTSYINYAKKVMSLHTIGRLFYLGIKLIQSIPPRHICDEQQSRLLRVFISILVDGVASWISRQGGWDDLLQRDRDQRRQSMPPALSLTSSQTYTPSLEPVQQVSIEPLTPTASLEEGLNSLNLGGPVDTDSRENLYTTSCPQLGHSASPKPFVRQTSSSVRIPRKNRPLTLAIRRNNSLPNHAASDSPSTGRSFGSVAMVGVGVSFAVALYAYLYN